MYAGEAATGYHISIWLALAALSLALLSCDRKTAGRTHPYPRIPQGMVPRDTNDTLSHYSEKLLDTYTAMFANATFITYAFYTFLKNRSRKDFFFKNYTEFTPNFPTGNG